MATHHASPAEVVDLGTWAQDLPNEKTKAIVKTDEMELARLVIPAGKEIPTHKVTGPIIVHCISGEIELTAMGKTQLLMPNQLLYLMSDEPHLVKAVEDSVVLLTIILKA
ncbi:MAG TPA: cupin domain-containing protein [Thiopseudomonas sp.]|nr:cupin domain-containing protein [Thiopseudomonas sp.]